LNTLYIRLTSRFAASDTARWQEVPCAFALTANEGTTEREGSAPFATLCALSAKVRRVVLLLAASDVTLLRVQVPPLPAAKLKAALPNLVEDQVLGDPSRCVAVADSPSGGLRTVAVVQRDWLEFLTRTLMAGGARRVAALPAQMCLPCEQNGVAAALSERANGMDMTLRFNAQEGMGLALAAGQEQGGESGRHEAIRTLRALASGSPLTLYVPQAALGAYREADSQIHVEADNWMRWIDGARGVTLDLLAGSGEGAARVEWRAWRWPMALAAAVLLTHAIALNVDWWRMKHEARALRAAMVQVYQSAYPDERVILDPVAQMQQKIALARLGAGQPASDDFVVILAAFGEAWHGAMPGVAAIEALEYRERSLFVRFMPGIDAPMQRMQEALAGRKLLLEAVSAQPVVWKIRSTP
jgi:general secretion pathway protein L